MTGPQHKKEKFIEFYSVPRWSFRKFRPNSENEACHEKDDTETDTDDAAIAAGGRLGGHSPLPERDRSIGTRRIILNKY